MKVKTWPLILAALYLLVLGVLASVGGTSRGIHVLALVSLLPFAVIAVIFIAVALIFYAGIGFHELGHYVFGKLVGFQFWSSAVGPVGIKVLKNRAVFFRVRPAWNGGYMAMLPTDGENFARRFAVFIAGGPFFSVLWLGLSLLAWPLLGFAVLGRIPLGSSIPQVLLHLALSVWTVFAASTLVSSLVPYQTRSGLASDCLRLIQLSKDDGKNLRTLALLTLQRLILAGTRVRDLPIETIKEAASLNDGSMSELIALQIQWAHELTYDRRATEQTLQRILTIAAQLGTSLNTEWRSALSQIQALQAVFIRHDTVAGEHFLAASSSMTPTSESSRATLMAGIAAIRHDPGLAQKIKAARQAIQSASATTSISLDWEEDWLNAMATGWPPIAAEGEKPPVLSVVYPRGL